MTSLHSAEHKRLIFIPEFRRLRVALTQKAHGQAQLRLPAQGPSRPCSFYIEAVCFLEIKTTEKQEQGCQGLLTCCLGLFLPHQFTSFLTLHFNCLDTVRKKGFYESLKSSQLLISHSNEGKELYMAKVRGPLRTVRAKMFVQDTEKHQRNK